MCREHYREATDELQCRMTKQTGVIWKLSFSENGRACLTDCPCRGHEHKFRLKDGIIPRSRKLPQAFPRRPRDYNKVNPTLRLIMGEMLPVPH